MKLPLLLLVATVTVVTLPAAAEVDLTKLPPPAKKAGVNYLKDIRPLFEASCFRCHGEEKQKGDLRLDSLEAVLQGGKDGEVIVPGKSDKSLLVIAVSGLDEEHAMPPKRKPGMGPGGPGGRRGFGGPGGPRPPGEEARRSGPGADEGPASAGRSQRPPPSPESSGGSGPGGPNGPGRPPGPGGGMGPMGKPLTAEQVSLVRAWVDQGAK